MNKVQLLFGIHCHQPIGNFDFIFENVYQHSYRPFLEVLCKHPAVKVTLHYSGGLLEWIERNHPDWFDLVRGLTLAGQVELLGGGFYEPILAAIPEHDRVEQVKWLSEYLNDKFGQRPRGMWLAERVWDSAIVKSIRRAGIQYVLVDDYHLISAGLSQPELHGYYLTEEEGHTLAVFPIDANLRYLTPFQPPEKTIDYLREIAQSGESACAIVVDDGEKYGSWPHTFAWVYEQGWLEQFFSLLEHNQNWVVTATFSEVMAQQRPLGRIYLPTASYFEMGQWSLPANRARQFSEVHRELENNCQLERFRPFIRGGIWKNFLVKYPESNNMHKKMLYLSERLKSLPAGMARAEAERELYRGQTNDAYWHGVFGGLYLPHLRHAIYRHLIACEQVLDAREGKTTLSMEMLDIDKDGAAEIVIAGPAYTCILTPISGGQMYEFSVKELKTNILNTLSRRFEHYHAQPLDMSAPAEEDGIPSIHHHEGQGEAEWRRELYYDRYERRSFIDHFFADQVSLAEYATGQYVESGDFVAGEYTVQMASGKEGGVILQRQGRLKHAGWEQPIMVSKTFTFTPQKCQLRAEYLVENCSETPVNVTFGIEFNLSMPACGSEWGQYQLNGEPPEPSSLASWGEDEGVKQVSLVDRIMGGQVTLSWDQPAWLWRWPVETVSQSEQGWEKTYQSSMVMPRWKLELKPGESWRVNLNWVVENLADEWH
ncbi:MAG: DUF1926 domain-containing protein [Firmicutes bacterium]|nr:DUF1926 domain-containing protein [Bacillota bacterium]